MSGLKFSYNSTNPATQKITSVTLPNGTPIDRGATYTVAAKSFIATGGDGFTVFNRGVDREVGAVDLDALVDYIDALAAPVNTAVEGRITTP